jgi:ribosome-associated heat shock protein Hsp15
LTDQKDRQRVDKWLWHARLVRTRAAAAALAAGGYVRLNGARIDAASRAVKAGDVVTVALDRRVRVLKVTGFSERRGSPADVAGLFEDLDPVVPGRPQPDTEVSTPGQRGMGAGRPTKRQHRDMLRFTRAGRDDG